jgi:hypothetical protein
MYRQFTGQYVLAALKQFCAAGGGDSRIAECADPGYGENAGTSDRENPG